jgi:two-component system chemotaxis sensor kinase CheA
MTDDEFLEDFILEAGEQLSELNEALLRIEKNPDDSDAVNLIFRAAHTLKGNSATMGFMDISGLAHKIENVLDGVRQGTLEITGEIVDTLFEGLDGLESMVDSASKGDEPVDCSAISKRLEKIGLTVNGKKPRASVKKTKKLKEKPGSGSKTFKITVVISNKANLKSMRAFMILKNFESLGEIIESNPDLKSVERGDFGDSFDVHLGTDATPEEITSQIRKVGDVESFEINEEAGSECKPATSLIKEVKSIRVGTDKLDELVNLVGELIINKSMFSQLTKDSESIHLNTSVKNLGRLSKGLQDLALSMRTVKVAHVFDKFPRMVRDLAKKEGKKIEFIMDGKEIELDRTVLDLLGDPLVHLIRNCIDHGIELPEVRENAGKSPKGTIKLSARRVRDHVEIQIEDDGGGIDLDELRKAALKRGFLTPDEAELLGDEDILALIFKPGFSGAGKVTEVSGRGVGMDVVKNTITKLRGTVHTKSEKGKGTTFTMKLPLSLAIIKALLVKSQRNIYAVPTRDMVEVLNLEEFKIKKVKGKEAIIHRGDPLPLLRLEGILKSKNGDTPKAKNFIVIEDGGKKKGLVVGEILRQEDIVIKPLEVGVGDVLGISGATILGDGQVALILDVHNLT